MVGMVSLIFVIVELYVRLRLVCRWFCWVVWVVVSVFGNSISVVMIMLMKDCGNLVVEMIFLMIGDFILVRFIIVIKVMSSNLRFSSVVWVFGGLVWLLFLIVFFCVIGRKKF